MLGHLRHEQGLLPVPLKDQYAQRLQIEHPAIAAFLDIGALHKALGVLQEGAGLLEIAPAGGHLRQAHQGLQDGQVMTAGQLHGLMQEALALIKFCALQMQLALQHPQASKQHHMPVAVGL
ncbi:hypothetical protein D3C76_1113310 [compost metagenome]